MTPARWVRKLKIPLAAALFAGMPLSAPAQGWKPERPVEIIVDCTPGCGPDNMARLMQRIFQSSGIPTWREQGANAAVFIWRAMFGAKGMTAAQIAYWENTFQRLIETPEWKAEMIKRTSITQFMGAEAMKKRMEEEYPVVKALLVDLELAKQ
jgi:tripartite-type tricarboxylate transporter receptor subunit TctC